MKWQRSSIIASCLIFEIVGCAAPLAVPTAPATPANPFQTTTAGDTTVVAFTPPSQQCCRRQTLPEFLGITQCVNGVRTRCGQELAGLGFLFPGLGADLQPGPPLLPITDPANFNSDVPAISTAAEIKAQEDAAPQKIAALRYLSTIGCAGCYEGVEEAFVASMDDCTEEVRYEAVLAIRKTTTCPCEHCNCKNGSCCSEKIQKKLLDLVYGMDDFGNPKECSERVRRQARLALQQCGPPMTKPETPEPAEPPAREAPPESPPESAAGEENPTAASQKKTPNSIPATNAANPSATLPIGQVRPSPAVQEKPKAILPALPSRETDAPEREHSAVNSPILSSPSLSPANNPEDPSLAQSGPALSADDEGLSMDETHELASRPLREIQFGIRR